MIYSLPFYFMRRKKFNMDVYNEISDGKRVPIIGNFELTRKCGFNCAICYNERRNSQEITFNEVKNLVDELAEMGCLYLNLTGGDPLIRKDFCEIYMYIYEKGIIPSVETALSCLTDEQIKIFKKYRPEKLQISIYGIDDKIMQRTTRSNIKARDILDRIKLLKKEGIEFTLRTPFTKLNISQAGEIAKFARQISDYTCTTKIFWKQSGERCVALRCNPEDIEPYLKNDIVYDKLYREAVKLRDSKLKKRDCCTGIYDFNITAYNTLNYCITFWKPEYDLRKGSFRDAWENWYPIFRRQENNYCLAKKIFSMDNKICPYGEIYSNEKFDCSVGLETYAYNCINSLRKSGMTEEEISEYLELDPKPIIKIEKMQEKTNKEMTEKQINNTH